MEADDLVYDHPNLYCRIYKCPNCDTFYEAYLDGKGNRMESKDRWVNLKMSKCVLKTDFEKNNEK
jgi:hypothetical protein